jgi:hypothetical protein
VVGAVVAMLIRANSYAHRKSLTKNILAFEKVSFAIDHRTWKTGLPVRSAVLKPCAGRLVVGWVTTSEYLLLIVLPFWTKCPMGHFLKSQHILR